MPEHPQKFEEIDKQFTILHIQFKEIVIKLRIELF